MDYQQYSERLVPASVFETLDTKVQEIKSAGHTLEYKDIKILTSLQVSAYYNRLITQLQILCPGTPYHILEAVSIRIVELENDGEELSKDEYRFLVNQALRFW